jgi:hypothetical protein
MFRPTMQQSEEIEAIEICERNYGKLYDYFRPKIELALRTQARKYNLDRSDVEEVYCNSLYIAIKKWDKTKQDNCQFTTWFWTVSQQQLCNTALYEAVERKRRWRLREQLLPERNRAPGDCHGILNEMIRQETLTYIFKKAEKIHTFHELLVYLRKHMVNCQSRSKIIGMTVKDITRKHRLCKQSVYNRMNQLQAYLTAVCKELEVNILSLKDDKTLARMKLIKTLACRSCEQLINIPRNKVEPLVLKHGSVDKLVANFVCSKCQTKKDRAKRYPSHDVLDHAEEEKGDDIEWKESHSQDSSDTFSDLPYSAE